MNISTWVFLILGVVNTVLTIWFTFKVLMRLEKRITQVEKFLLEDVTKKNQIDVSDSVAIGLVKGLQQMREDDERHLKLLEMGRNLQRTPLKIMSQSSLPKNFNTGGDLIPDNLTKDEEEVLRMYYDRTNER
jgi:hypothetical protein